VGVAQLIEDLIISPHSLLLCLKILLCTISTAVLSLWEANSSK
ncbi:MAG: hypothetical protein ACI9QD_000637, partial [Thermoproteota archaeon]